MAMDPFFMQYLLTLCPTIYPVSDIKVSLCLLEVIKVMHSEINVGCMYR